MSKIRRAVKEWLAGSLPCHLVDIGGRMVGLLPRRFGVALGGALGRLACLLDRRDRRWTLQHLELAYGDELTRAERRALARRVFDHHGRSFIELLYGLRLDPDELAAWMRFDGFEAVEAARAEGRGVMLITGHLGNWELTGLALGLRVPLYVIARRVANPRLDRMMVDARARTGVRTIIRDAATERVEIERAFASGGVLATLIDQDSVKTRGVFVPFFGRPAYTPSGPAALALKLDLPVVALCPRRLPDGNHLTEFRRVHPRRTGDLEADVLALTETLTCLIEAWVRRCPWQWSWFHRRWQTTPARLEEIAARERRTARTETP